MQAKSPNSRPHDLQTQLSWIHQKSRSPDDSSGRLFLIGFGKREG
ncbi:hypothetical protein RISK_000935 [Rhodopirellula islandica]|uniref:Uncharacterized protein n=1 Tax=Rhodopirellula islandica TaxID=595434 RepID=A0A0J1ENQ4_RHOIS|nr:hypothetical protein RISK_000935 [Rhodopirellula islandica]